MFLFVAQYGNAVIINVLIILKVPKERSFAFYYMEQQRVVPKGLIPVLPKYTALLCRATNWSNLTVLLFKFKINFKCNCPDSCDINIALLYNKNILTI